MSQYIEYQVSDDWIDNYKIKVPIELHNTAKWSSDQFLSVVNLNLQLLTDYQRKRLNLEYDQYKLEFDENITFDDFYQAIIQSTVES